MKRGLMESAGGKKKNEQSHFTMERGERGEGRVEKRLIFATSASQGNIPKEVVRGARVKRKEVYFVRDDVARKKKRGVVGKGRDTVDGGEGVSRSRSRKKKGGEEGGEMERRGTKGELREKSGGKKRGEKRIGGKKKEGKETMGNKSNDDGSARKIIKGVIKDSKMSVDMRESRGKVGEKEGEEREVPVRMKGNDLELVGGKNGVTVLAISNSGSSGAIKGGYPTPHGGIEARFLRLAQENEMRWKNFLENLNDMERGNPQNSFVKKVKEYKTKVEVCIKAVQGVAGKKEVGRQESNKVSPRQKMLPVMKEGREGSSLKQDIPMGESSSKENPQESDLPVREDVKKRLPLEINIPSRVEDRYIGSPSAEVVSIQVPTDKIVPSIRHLRYAQEVWKSPSDSKLTISSTSNIVYGNREEKFLRPSARLWRACGLQSLSVVEVQNSSKLHRSIDRKIRPYDHAKNKERREDQSKKEEVCCDLESNLGAGSGSLRGDVSLRDKEKSDDYGREREGEVEIKETLKDNHIAIDQGKDLEPAEGQKRDRRLWDDIDGRGEKDKRDSAEDGNRELSIIDIEALGIIVEKRDSKVPGEERERLKDTVQLPLKTAAFTIADGADEEFGIEPWSPPKESYEDSVDINYGGENETNSGQKEWRGPRYQLEEGNNKSILFTTIEEKSDIITSFILENLVVEAISEDHCVDKFISILGSHLRDLERSSLETYFSELIRTMSEAPGEMAAVERRLNTPLGQSDIHRLLLASAVLTEEDQEVVGSFVYEPVVDIRLYVQLEEKLKDSLYRQRGYEPLEMEREHIIHKAIFDSFNEELDHRRIFGIFGPPLRASTRFREGKRVGGTEVEVILQESKDKVVRWASTNAGTYLHKEPVLAHLGDFDELERLRDRLMLGLMDEYVG